MPAKPSLQTYVSEETKAKFATAAKQYGCSNEAQFLRLLIDRILKNEPAPLPKTKGTKRVQINVGLTPEETDQVAAAAARQGLPRTAWIVNLIRAHVFRQPQFAPAEIEGLMESNRQLAAIGRNLNQIARSLNLDVHASRPDTHQAIEDLAKEIKRHRSKVAGLMDANLNRWGLPK